MEKKWRHHQGRCVPLAPGQPNLMVLMVAGQDEVFPWVSGVDLANTVSFVSSSP